MLHIATAASVANRPPRAPVSRATATLPSDRRHQEHLRERRRAPRRTRTHRLQGRLASLVASEATYVVATHLGVKEAEWKGGRLGANRHERMAEIGRRKVGCE
jgi:hypothetical protein